MTGRASCDLAVRIVRVCLESASESGSAVFIPARFLPRSPESFGEAEVLVSILERGIDGAVIRSVVMSSAGPDKPGWSRWLVGRRGSADPPIR